MLKAIKARRAFKQARARYRMAVLEGLMADNQRRLAEIRAMRKCRVCEDMESPKDPHPCAPTRASTA